MVSSTPPDYQDPFEESRTNWRNLAPLILRSHFDLSSYLAALLLAGSANAALNTNLVNSGFATNGGAFFNPVVNGWMEHEVYVGAGPNGNGCGIWSSQVIPSASGSSLSLIGGDSGTNTATVMQSLGTVAASDVGKTFRLSAGAVAWDWYATVHPFSGTVTVSFRKGCTPDNGNTASFNYGTLLGTAGSVTTGVSSAGDGFQNGIGDDGGLISVAANYSPTVADVGTQVFAVINLGNVALAPAGESRFVVDNAALSVSTNQPPSVSIASPTNGATFFLPANITLAATATAGSSNASIASVEFFAGSTSLGIVMHAPYTLTITNVAPAVITYTARATDSLGNWSISAPVTITTLLPLRITDIHRAGDGSITLTWNSLPGLTYAVDTSTNLSAWAEFAAEIPTGGALTSCVIPAGSTPNPSTEKTLYFRVRQGPTIQLVEINTPSDGTGYSVFQSHNQKVVANTNGIFITYLDSCPDTSPNTWRLARSTDGGHTFTTVYQGSDYTRAPAMETDETNNIYLTYPTYGTNTHFLRFTAANGYTAPNLTQAYSGVSSAAKYAMAYDRQRQRFYIATQYGLMLTVDKSGNLLQSQQVFSTSRSNSYTAYPNLLVDAAGVLHFGETTADGGNHIPYESIRHLQSADGGATWQTMGGTPVTAPTTPEPTGPSDMINLPDEITPWATWLSATHVKGGKVHFAYRTVNPWDPAYFGNPTPIMERQHYMRFNGSTGVREIDSWSDWGRWGGTNISVAAVDGLLASDPNDPSGPIYFVGLSSSGVLSAIISHDNGSSWNDYASATTQSALGLSSIYSVGGCRTLAPDGKVIGSLSAMRGGVRRTYFYSIRGYSAP